MGEVCRAGDTRLGRDVAIKVLPARLEGDRDAEARFEREAKAVAALSHPNILAIHDVGSDGARVYTVMDDRRYWTIGDVRAVSPGLRPWAGPCLPAGPESTESVLCDRPDVSRMPRRHVIGAPGRRGLRHRLAPSVRQPSSDTPGVYRPVPTPGRIIMNATHIVELRSAVVALE
jgi:hypothetical protein